MREARTLLSRKVWTRWVRDDILPSMEMNHLCAIRVLVPVALCHKCCCRLDLPYVVHVVRTRARRCHTRVILAFLRSLCIAHSATLNNHCHRHAAPALELPAALGALGSPQPAVL